MEAKDISMEEVRKMAKDAGVNPFGKSKDAVLNEVRNTSKDSKVEKSYNREEKGRQSANATDQDLEIGGLKFRKRGRTLNTYEDVRALHVPDHLKNPNLDYRWVNDDKGRVQALEAVDYQKVPSGHFAEHVETVRHAGIKKDGSEMKAYLMATPKEFRAKRHARKQSQLDQTERKMEKMQDPNMQVSGSEFYGGLKISHGNS